MESTLPSSFQSVQPQTIPQPVSWRLGIPTYIYAAVFSSLCIIWGVIWDIMWHISIGRDGLFAPPHTLTYLGALTAGLFSAYQIFSLTFSKNQRRKAMAVPFWGVFYGSLGAMFCVWGALTMLTSAPFDDWWHNTYGLDVAVLTPPHSVLGIGINAVQLGAMIGVLALQNQYRNSLAAAPTPQKVRLTWLFAMAAALTICNVCTDISASIYPAFSHRSDYYAAAAIVLPLYLFAEGRASLLRWPITTIAALYFLFMGLPSWIIQNLPATPRLGPVLNPLTHYQPFQFPMLLFIPGFAVDWLMRRYETLGTGRKKPNDWLLAGLYALAFMGVLLVVQWPFSEFLLTSPYSRNGFFLGYGCNYDFDPNRAYRFAFAPSDLQSTRDFWAGFGRALLYATLSARIGLAWGNWMKKVVR